jgi:mannosyltransferase
MADPARLSRSRSRLSSRLQRRVEELLDRSEQSADDGDWEASKTYAREALAIDDDNEDALVLLNAAETMLAEAGAVARPRRQSRPSNVVALGSGSSWGAEARTWVEENKFLTVLALEALLGLVLGFLFLGDKSFWLDEATTARLINLDWSALRHELESTETNQAFYYILLKFWGGLGGGGEFWLRSFSVLCAAATVPAVGLLGRSLFSQRVGLTAGLLLALNPVTLYYAQEARGYALAMLLVTLAAYALVMLIQKPSTEWAVAFAVLGGLAAYSHFFAILALGAMIVSLALLRKADVPWKLVGQSVAGLGVLLLPIAYESVSPTTNLNWVGKPNLDILMNHLESQAGGTLQMLVFSGVIAFGVFAAWKLLRSQDGASKAWPAAMVLSWLVLPTVVSFGGSYVKPVFVSRYLIVSLPALALFAAFALSQIRVQTLAYGLTGVFVLLMLPALDHVYFDMPKEEWRDVTSYVLSEAQPGDAIVFHSPWVEGPYQYYAVRADGGLSQPEVAHYDAVGNEAIGPRLQSEGHQRVWLVLAHAAFSAIPEIAVERENLENSLGSAYTLDEQEDFFGPIQVRLYD